MAGGAQAADAAVLAVLLVLAVGELGLPEVDEDGGGGCSTPLALACANDASKKKKRLIRIYALLQIRMHPENSTLKMFSYKEKPAKPWRSLKSPPATRTTST